MLSAIASHNTPIEPEMKGSIRVEVSKDWIATAGAMMSLSLREVAFPTVFVFDALLQYCNRLFSSDLVVSNRRHVETDIDYGTSPRGIIIPF